MWTNLFALIFCGFLNLALSKSDVNCSLSVSSKRELENEVFEYLHQNTRTLIVQYDLDFTRIGHNFDLSNRTNPNAFQPWRWYRTKGRGFERLLLFYFRYMFDSLMDVTFKYVKVTILASPAGCLLNITREDMEPFLRKVLLDDFGINADELRTSEKINKNAEICTAHIIPTATITIAELQHWCCGYDLHNEIYCHIINANSPMIIASVTIGIFTALLLSYTPLLCPKAINKRKIIYIQNNIRPTRFMVKATEKKFCRKSDNIFGARKGTEDQEYIPKELSFRENFNLVNRDKGYTIHTSEVHLVVNQNIFISEDERTFYNLTSFIAFLISRLINSNQMGSATIFIRILIKVIFFAILFTLPTIVCINYNYINNDFQNDFYQALVDRGLYSSGLTDSSKKMMIACFVVSCIFQTLIYVLIILDEIRFDDSFGICVATLPTAMKQQWQYILRQLNKCYRKRPWILIIYITFSPLLLYIMFFATSPMFLIMSARSNNRNMNSFSTLLESLMNLVVFPVAFFAQIFLVLMALVMLQASLVLPVLSGVAALLVNLNIFSMAVGRKHDECFRKLIYLVNKNKEADSEMITSTEEMTSNLYQSHIIQPTKSIIFRDNFLYLRIKKSPAYKIENGKTKINTSAILHCMRHIYLQAFIGFLALILFASAVISSMSIFGKLDYIDSSSQLLITFVTSIIPSFLMFGKSEKYILPSEAPSRNENNNPDKEEFVNIISKLESYKEDYLIDDMSVDEVEETASSIDLILTVSEDPEN